MKKRNLKSLPLNKSVVSSFNYHHINGGASPLTVDVKDCPGNTLKQDCRSLGACPVSQWCPPPPVCTNIFIDCCTIL